MEKKVTTFDLETISDKSVIPNLPPVKPDPRLKDSIKIKADIEKKEADQISKMGLNPTMARICCFGWHDGTKSSSFILKDESSEAEKALLLNAWDVLAEAEHFVTFNGNTFDVPMLLMRSLINRVRPSVKIHNKKYTIQNHTDVRAVLSNWDQYAPGTLDYYSRLLLGRSSKAEFDGSQVQDMWDMELYDDIAKYCEDDCECTFQIFELMTQFYL